MSIAQYRLSWDSYKNNVCEGFTSLQQNEEFVDMTLAADGHLVKVHKSIFALASPYIKSMIQSTANEHPIIFLGNVSHEILNYILTYVYTGEVSVEVNKIQSFMKAAKDLHLTGLFGMPIPKVGSNENAKRFHEPDNEEECDDNTVPGTENSVEESLANDAILIDKNNGSRQATTNFQLLDTRVSTRQINESNVSTVSTKDVLPSDTSVCQEPNFRCNEEMLNNRDSGLYMTADGYQYKLEIQQEHNKYPDSTPTMVDDVSDKTSQLMQITHSINNTVNSNNSNNDKTNSFQDEFKNKISSASFQINSLDPKAVTLQYTTSSRGSLQLILNRFMYYCHHQSHGGRKRRWRCIDYRSKHCPAFIDTDTEIMTSRKFGHAHSFHDEKIRKKMKRDLVFTNLNVLLQKQINKKCRKEIAS